MTPHALPSGVLVHVDEGDPDKHVAVLRNVGHLLDDLGSGTTVEVVAHGPGITLCLGDSPQADTVQSLIGRGVVVAACENTLRIQMIDPARLTAGVSTVASGIGELVRKQGEGWAYVRP